MDENKEKRMVSNTGYEVKQTLKIGSKEIILAENPQAENDQFYLVCNYTENGFIGEYSMSVTSDDYLEAMNEFTDRITTEVEKIQSAR